VSETVNLATPHDQRWIQMATLATYLPTQEHKQNRLKRLTDANGIIYANEALVDFREKVNFCGS